MPEEIIPPADDTPNCTPPLNWDQASNLASLMMGEVGQKLSPGDWVTVPYKSGNNRGRVLGKVLQIRMSVISSIVAPQLGFQTEVWIQVQMRGIRHGFWPIGFLPMTSCSPFPARVLAA